MNISHRRKIFFDSILTAELALCKNFTTADYVWDRPERIFTSKVRDNKILLKINLNLGKESIFKYEKEPCDTELYFRAYFISCYVRLLENAENFVPNNYFSGLVFLQGIEELESRRKTAFNIPWCTKKRRSVTPLSVYCGVNALNRMLIEFESHFNTETRKVCKRLIDEFFCYFDLPEISYGKRKSPVFSLFSMLWKTEKLLCQKEHITERYRFFKENKIVKGSLCSVETLLALAEKTENTFFSGIAARIFLFFPEVKNSSDYLKNDRIKESFSAIKKYTFEYFKICRDSDIPVIKDNFKGIRILAQKTDENCFEELSDIESGRLHRYS